MSRGLGVRETEIPGLLIVDLVCHGDERGWFKENWQRAKMVALGLPDFGPVQHSVAYNQKAGVLRGFHAEPWDKLVSVTQGRVFGAWVDLRPGEAFGRLVTVEMGSDTAVYVPRGVANSYQSTEDETVYSYLANNHWSLEARSSYSYVNVADPVLDVAWPIPLESAVISEADMNHPPLSDARPVAPRRSVIVGGSGLLSRALQVLLPDAEVLGSDRLDLSDTDAVAAYPWTEVEVIINTAAYTATDEAETEEGRRRAWAVNAAGAAALAAAAQKNRCVLVHVSSDYVFDGSVELHTEDEPFSPLSVYGSSKAAGDVAVAQGERHYIVRTSWVVGEGRNFVRTMADLARRGISPSVVDDQFGRLTFAEDLAAGIVHLISTDAPYGTYNLTNSGPVQSWWNIAREVFALCGRDLDDVIPVSTEDYGGGKIFAPRPRHSALALEKIVATGFRPPAPDERLRTYVAGLSALNPK